LFKMHTCLFSCFLRYPLSPRPAVKDTSQPRHHQCLYRIILLPCGYCSAAPLDATIRCNTRSSTSVQTPTLKPAAVCCRFSAPAAPRCCRGCSGGWAEREAAAPAAAATAAAAAAALSSDSVLTAHHVSPLFAAAQPDVLAIVSGSAPVLAVPGLLNKNLFWASQALLLSPKS
jgi:hypothetical protein